MDERVVNEKPKLRWVTNLAGGCLIILYIGLFAAILIFSHWQTAVGNIPTPTPTQVPDPHILVRQPAKNITVVHEDFSANRREWGLYFDYGKLEVISGKLILQSNLPDGFTVGINQRIVPASENYYVQADFSTDIENVSSYGLVFGLNQSLATFYLFEIWPQSQGIRLLKYNAGKWTEVMPLTAAVINPFPSPNTLSVYFDKGDIELYVNGKLVTNYSDKDYFQSKDIGVYVNNAGFRLLVDNIFVYDEK
jgi:hypothetical protein